MPPGSTSLLALAAALPALAPGHAPSPPVERQVAVMGTTLRVEVTGLDREHGLALAERLVRAVEDAEVRLSTWRETSEIETLNRAPVGEPVPLSRSTWAALGRALDWAAASDGAFDPTMAPLVQAWGLRSAGRHPAPAEVRAALGAIGAGGIELTRAPLGAQKRLERRIEEGGFGKGAALDDALDLLEPGEPAAENATFVRIDLGGQIAWSGAREPVVVELADPAERARPVVAIELDAARGSVATSGNGERRLVLAGKAVGHLLDPRSGYPAPDFGSVAVFAPAALDADCLSTALFVLGPERGARWLSARGREFQALFLVTAGDRLRAVATPGLAGRVRPLVPGLRIDTAGGSS